MRQASRWDGGSYSYLELPRLSLNEMHNMFLMLVIVLSLLLFLRFVLQISYTVNRLRKITVRRNRRFGTLVLEWWARVQAQYGRTRMHTVTLSSDFADTAYAYSVYVSRMPPYVRVQAPSQESSWFCQQNRTFMEKGRRHEEAGDKMPVLRRGDCGWTIENVRMILSLKTFLLTMALRSCLRQLVVMTSRYRGDLGRTTICTEEETCMSLVHSNEDSWRHM